MLWIPARVGVEGNEEVDKLAKSALRKEEIDIEISLSKTEVKGIIKTAVGSMWQNVWNKGRHLFRIQHKVGIERKVYGNRREDTVITRIRIGSLIIHCI